MTNVRRIESVKGFPALGTLENGDKIKVNQQTDDGKLPGGSHHGASLGELNVQRMETVIADRTLVAADSGKTIILSAAAGFDTLLPALLAGLKFKFIIGTDAATSNYTLTATADVIFGSATVDGAAVPCAGTKNTINFVHTNKAAKGDWVELECDGTNWYVAGQGEVAGSITFADV